MSILLAKSEPRETLMDHTENCLSVFDSLRDRMPFYVLPYIASINAMYRRLERLVSEERLGLLHGKAAYFLYRDLSEGLLGNVTKS